MSKLMMQDHTIDQYRRKLITMAMALPVFALTPRFVQSKTPDPIKVDVSGVTDVPSLITAIKKAAGNLLPASISDDVFYREFAKTFVDNARSAYENGFQVPQWILDKLPRRNAVLPLLALGVVILMISGVPFLVAVGIVISAVIASIVLMAAAISAVLYSLSQPTTHI
jgi:hypothetical protein